MIKGESHKSAALNELEDSTYSGRLFHKWQADIKKISLERNSTGKGDTNRIRVMNARVEMSRWRKNMRMGR